MDPLSSFLAQTGGNVSGYGPYYGCQTTVTVTPGRQAQYQSGNYDPFRNFNNNSQTQSSHAVLMASNGIFLVQAPTYTCQRPWYL